MHLNWILSPLALYGALALALMGSLWLFVTLKFEVCEVRRRAELSREALAAQVQATDLGVALLRESVTEIGERPAFTSSDLNAARRTQALRMYRRGESAGTIATALRAPRNEIELLFKLQEMLQERKA